MLTNPEDKDQVCKQTFTRCYEKKVGPDVNTLLRAEVHVHTDARVYTEHSCTETNTD